jgi:hypothetical protein
MRKIFVFLALAFLVSVAQAEKARAALVIAPAENTGS